MKKKTLTPDVLLSSWELKEYVNKYSPDHLKPHFDIAFNKIKLYQMQGLRISALIVRGNIQVMLDNLNDEENVIKFKKFYK